MNPNQIRKTQLDYIESKERLVAPAEREGGELAMWMDEISDAEFLEKRGDKYAIPLELLASPDFSVKPRNGDLIPFNARKLHAVLPGSGTDRLTLSAFFGYRGNANNLTVWS